MRDLMGGIARNCDCSPGEAENDIPAPDPSPY